MLHGTKHPTVVGAVESGLLDCPAMSDSPSAITPPLLARPGRWRIGLFDSGVGGLSILRDLRAALPAAELLYVADSAHAPYGERDVAHILARSDTIAGFLKGQGAQVLIVACNTATAAAVKELREQHLHWPIIGVEPGLKPAVAATRSGRISVMATTSTLASEKFQQLLRACSHRDGLALHIHQQACPGLAHAIEQGDLNSPQVIELVQRFCDSIAAHAADTVVLGCTHYPLVRHHIEAALGRGVTVIDTAEAIARRAISLCSDLPQIEASDAPVPTRLWTSGDANAVALIARHWLDFPVEVQSLPPAWA